MASWTGSAEGSFFDYEKLTNIVLLILNELKNLEPHDDFYLLSVDVGRLSCQTVVCVHKIHQVEKYIS